jgi:hypothetical protein
MLVAMLDGHDIIAGLEDATLDSDEVDADEIDQPTDYADGPDL